MADFTTEQRQAIDAEGNTVVTAGAGAGKTRVLVQRYLRLLTKVDSCTPGEIIAITFTNKAAKEMKDRIRREIYKIRAGVPAVKRRDWDQISQQLESAPICTIHSLCTRLLRENPVEAALDPNFAVLDEVEADFLLDAAAEQVISKALTAGPEWFGILADYYGKNGIAGKLLPLYKRLAAEDLFGPGLSELLGGRCRADADRMDAIRKDCKQAVRDLVAASASMNKTTEQYQKIKLIADNFEAVAGAIDACGKGDEAAQALIRRFFYNGKKIAAQGKVKEFVNDIYTCLETMIKTPRAVELSGAIEAFLVEIDQTFSEEKARRHVLTFTDLEVRTLALLRSSPAVRNRYLSQFRYLMVDEFQDTNDIQRRIVYFLAGGSEERLLGGKLFVVGDPKQSIYRFRGADVTVFERVSQDITGAGGQKISLEKNFRSVKPLLDAYNGCFTGIMGSERDATVPFRRLEPHRRHNADSLCAECIIIDVPGDDAAQTRQTEALILAERIKRMVENEELIIAEEDHTRPVNYKDIAILFQSRADLGIYERALREYGVPFYVLGGRGFFQRQEIIDIINLLRTVENQEDEAALAGTLRSPFFLLADETLVWLKRKGPSLWQGLADSAALPELAPEQREAASKAWQLLNRLIDIKGLADAAELIEMAVRETEYDAFVLTQFMGLQQYANIHKLIDMAREFQRTGFNTLGDFIRYLEKLIETEADESEAQIESEAGNTVKLMTVHGSKGLEFPVVVLPDLRRNFYLRQGKLAFDAEFGLGLDVKKAWEAKSMSTACLDAIKAKERDLDLLEKKRLLYVAMTRAEDYLIMSSTVNLAEYKAPDKDYLELYSWMDWIIQALKINPANLTGEFSAGHIRFIPQAAPRTPPPENSQPKAIGQRMRTDDGFGVPQEIKKRILPYREKAWQPPRSFSATSLAAFRRCRRAFYYQYLLGLPQIEAGSFAGVKGTGAVPANLVGLAVHRCCQIIGPGQNPDECLNASVRDAVPAEWQQAVYDEALPIVKKFAAGDFYQQIRTGKTEREKPFYYYPVPNGEFFFTGWIDLVLHYPDGSLGLVDYKTDDIPAEAAPARAEEYGWQLKLYALAAQALYGCPVKDARLYFVRPGALAEVAVDRASLNKALDEMVSACQYINSHGDEKDYDPSPAECRWCGYRAVCSDRS